MKLLTPFVLGLLLSTAAYAQKSPEFVTKTDIIGVAAIDGVEISNNGDSNLLLKSYTHAGSDSAVADLKALTLEEALNRCKAIRASLVARLEAQKMLIMKASCAANIMSDAGYTLHMTDIEKTHEYLLRFAHTGEAREKVAKTRASDVAALDARRAKASYSLSVEYLKQ